MTKKAFLANPRNKQKFLYFIGSELEKAGVELYHSAGDADYDIMSTAYTVPSWPRGDQWQWSGTTPTCWSAAAPISQSQASCHLPVSKILNNRQ